MFEYVVTDGIGVTVNGTSYEKGDIISGNDARALEKDPEFRTHKLKHCSRRVARVDDTPTKPAIAAVPSSVAAAA